MSIAVFKVENYLYLFYSHSQNIKQLIRGIQMANHIYNKVFQSS